ncbi:hypothetical protein CAEBREN_19952 [Caenorhabditis brenneri]|uniref:DUF4781 domain-containing protein n=1 Tax=Caenorhabditis brenneri TaxID=135651 RepID=G0P773_CAEBE|nr:hypothetical protein CAEBREN_19952 [Caenorhabditis brenneri]
MTIFVAETIKKEAFYTAKCLDATSSDGTKNQLEINNLVNVQVPNSKEDILNTVDGAVRIISGAATIGMVLNPPPINVALGVLAGFGSLISLNDKITARFDDMSAFIAENKFSMEVLGEAALLKKLLNDVLTRGTKESLANFKAAYEQNPPLSIGYVLMSLLSQKSTNPLVSVMEGDEKKSRTSFKKWRDILLTVIGDLVFIESIACGYLKKQDMFDCELLLDLHKEIWEIILSWDEDYIEWKAFKNDFEKLMSTNSDWTNSEKVNYIKDCLKDKCTEQPIYIGVFNDADWENDVFIQSYDPDECMALVKIAGQSGAFAYRSNRIQPLSDADYDGIKQRLEGLKKIPLFNGMLLANIWEVLKSQFRQDGLIALMKETLDLQTQWANCEREPGVAEKIVFGDESVFPDKPTTSAYFVACFERIE